MTLSRSLTQELVKRLFDYRNGELYWKTSRRNQIKIGDIAGCVGKDGYSHIEIDGRNFLTHRIIFLWHTGLAPKIVDHEDNNPSNNKIENLRGVTHSQNQFNRKINCNSKTGVKGVDWDNKNKKFRARIQVCKRSIFVGQYDNLQDAKTAIEKAREQLHGDFARHA